MREKIQYRIKCFDGLKQNQVRRGILALMSKKKYICPLVLNLNRASKQQIKKKLILF
jgi:hypothetical protein